MLELNENGNKARELIKKRLENDRLKYKSNFWKSYLFHLLIGGHLISGIITIFFMNWGKLSFIEIMYLQSYFWIMILIFEIPCGAISDYLSRKTALFLGSLTTGIAALVYSITPNLIFFILGETLWAFGEAQISGTNTAITYETLKKLDREDEIAKFSARNVSFYVAGIGISAPIGSVLTLVIPMQMVVTLMLIPFLCASVFALTLKEPNHQSKKESSNSKSYLKTIKSGIKELKSNKNLRTLAFDQVAAEGLIFIIFWTYQPYLIEFGVLVVYLGLIGTALTVMQVIFMNLVPKINEKIDNKRSLLLIFTIIPGAGFIFLTVLKSGIIIIILFMIIVGFGMSRSMIHVKSINKHIETENRATVLSTINMLSTIIKAILFPVAGYIVASSLSFCFIILGIIMLIIALLSRVRNIHLI